jgi:hypothetical protein
LGSIIRNDARCTREIKYRIAMAKAAFNKNSTILSYFIAFCKKRKKCGRE